MMIAMVSGPRTPRVDSSADAPNHVPLAVIRSPTWVGPML
jgi:hypothetical protein